MADRIRYTGTPLMISHARLNLLVRIALALVGFGALALLVVAARPWPRYQGSIVGAAETALPMIDDRGQVNAVLTMSHPAVVSFPTDWKLPDQICMVVHIQRGETPTTLPFDEYLPQPRWDDRPESALVFAPKDITIHTEDNAYFALADPFYESAIESNLPYRVQWVGNEPILLYINQAVDRLLCYHANGVNRSNYLPFTHLIRFRVENAHIVHDPAFLLAYNLDPVTPVPDTIVLTKVSIESYLADLVQSGSPVVLPMSAAQRAQRETESAPR